MPFKDFLRSLVMFISNFFAFKIVRFFQESLISLKLRRGVCPVRHTVLTYYTFLLNIFKIS